MAELIEAISIQDDDYIVIKFDSSLRRASIVDNNFKLKTTADDLVIPNAFDPINLDLDYNALTRILKLHFRKDALASNGLQPNTEYELEISGLQNAIGTTFPTHHATFTTDPVFEDEYVKPKEPEIVIEDHSIKDQVYVGTDSVEINDGSTSNETGLYVRRVTPENGSVYLLPDENSGIIEIVFSARVKEEQLTSTYFKVQRKKLTQGPSRWENIFPTIEQDVNRPIVYVRLPANEPSEYFEPGYKYRVIISRALSVEPQAA